MLACHPRFGCLSTSRTFSWWWERSELCALRPMPSVAECMRLLFPLALHGPRGRFPSVPPRHLYPCVGDQSRPHPCAACSVPPVYSDQAACRSHFIPSRFGAAGRAPGARERVPEFVYSCPPLMEGPSLSIGIWRHAFPGCPWPLGKDYQHLLTARHFGWLGRCSSEQKRRNSSAPVGRVGGDRSPVRQVSQTFSVGEWRAPRGKPREEGRRDGTVTQALGEHFRRG